MSEVANKIDRFLNSILLLSENQHEILVGSCTSGVSLTNTQEHILMLVADESLTNSVLAKKLNGGYHEGREALIKSGHAGDLSR